MLILPIALLFVGTALAEEPRPPVILIDGYYANCSTAPFSSTAFGRMEAMLLADGVRVEFFRPCSVPSSGGGRPRATIAELGQALGKLIDEIGAPQVDLVGYSLGAFISRCYISGKQNEPGVFQPPANHKVRKLVFLAGCHFDNGGGPIVPENQAAETEFATRFIWDIATWNQGTDDFRQIDSIAVIGNAKGSGDGGLELTTASITFARPPERTRVINACHGYTCYGLPGVAYANSRSHPSWLIIDSFLSGTDDWKTVGVPADQDPVLTTEGGSLVAIKDAADNLIQASEVRMSGRLLWQGQQDPENGFNDTTGLYFLKPLQQGDYTLEAIAPVPVPAAPFSAKMGTYGIVTMKPGPLIFKVLLPDNPEKLSTIPNGAEIEIHGVRLSTAGPQTPEAPLPATLAGTQVTVNGDPIQLKAVSESRVSAKLPSSVSGFVQLKVVTPEGSHAVNMFVDPPTEPPPAL